MPIFFLDYSQSHLLLVNILDINPQYSVLYYVLLSSANLPLFILTSKLCKRPIIYANQSVASSFSDFAPARSCRTLLLTCPLTRLAANCLITASTV